MVESGDENEIFEQLILERKEQLKSLHGTPKAKVTCAVNRVNCVLKKIDIRNLTELIHCMLLQHMFLNLLG